MIGFWNHTPNRIVTSTNQITEERKYHFLAANWALAASSATWSTGYRAKRKKRGNTEIGDRGTGWIHQLTPA